MSGYMNDQAVDCWLYRDGPASHHRRTIDKQTTEPDDKLQQTLNSLVPECPLDPFQ